MLIPHKHLCLVADHDAYMRRLMRDILRSLYIFDMDEATDGGQALAMMAENKFDLILMDVHLPVLGGGELVTKIRHCKENLAPTLPILAYSATITPQMLRDLRDAGVNEILAKPFSAGILAKRLRMALESGRPWVDTPTYVGPCRRHKRTSPYIGPLRRSSDQVQDTMFPDGPEVTAVIPPPAAVGAMSQADLMRRL